MSDDNFKNFFLIILVILILSIPAILKLYETTHLKNYFNLYWFTYVLNVIILIMFVYGILNGIIGIRLAPKQYYYKKI
jgi:hypothetical protein